MERIWELLLNTIFAPYMFVLYAAIVMGYIYQLQDKIKSYEDKEKTRAHLEKTLIRMRKEKEI